MRASVIVPLLLAALFGLGLRYSSPRQAPPTVKKSSERATAAAPAPIQSKPPARTDAKNVLWTVKAKGFPHANEKDAYDSALSEAGLALSEKYLKKLNPPVNWVPTPEFLGDEKRGIVKKQTPESSTVEVPNAAQSMVTITVDLELTDADVKAIQEHDRHARVEQRMWYLGRGLGGLVLLFGAIAGAIRLDEWTKGFCPGPLKLGLVGLAAVAAAALWVVV